MQKTKDNPLIIIRKSLHIVSKLSKGKDTGFKLVYSPDTWENVGPEGRVKLSDRSYVVQRPEGKITRDTWTVIRQSIDRITVKPIITYNNETFFMFLYTPYPAAGQWLIEFPSDIIRANETIKQTAKRILKETTGYTSNTINVLSKNILVAPFRFEQREIVAEATDINIKTNNLSGYRDSEVLLIPEKDLNRLLKHNIITDFKTRSIIAEHLLHSKLNTIGKNITPEITVQMKAAFWSISDNQALDRADAEALYVSKVIKYWQKKLRIKANKLLDIPCGLGQHHNGLTKAGFDICGIDIDHDFISVAKQRHQIGSSHYILGDMRHTNLPSESFDIILNLFTSLAHFDKSDQIKTLTEFHRILRPNGLLLIQFPNKQPMINALMPTYSKPITKDVIYIRRGFVNKNKHTIMYDEELLKRNNDYYLIVSRQKSKLRLFSIEETRKMIKDSGFSVLAVYTNLTMNPANKNDADILLIAKKI